jgi:hypothetical protein
MKNFYRRNKQKKQRLDFLTMIILKIIIIFQIFSIEFNIKISTDNETSNLRTGLTVDCVQCAM